MSVVEGKYEGGDVEAHFRAETYRDDLGVPRSEFTAVDEEGAELTALSILGVDVDVNTLPKALADEILNLRHEIDWSNA